MQTILLFTTCILSSTFRFNPEAREFIPGAPGYYKMEDSLIEGRSQSTMWTVNNLSGFVFAVSTEEDMRAEVTARFPDTSLYTHHLKQTGPSEFLIVKTVRNKIELSFPPCIREITISEDSLHIMEYFYAPPNGKCLKSTSISKIENRALWPLHQRKGYKILDDTIPIFIEYGEDTYMFFLAEKKEKGNDVAIWYVDANRKMHSIVAIYSIEEGNSIRFHKWNTHFKKDIDSDQIVGTRFISFE